jgi:demethylmenaquinone methyltransferase/2-methoxy-6-polyprenyl-1,4-benzoquinol methylase
LKKKGKSKKQAEILEQTWYTEEGMERMCAFVSKFRIKRGSCVLNIGTRTGNLVPLLKRKVRKDGKVLALDHSHGILRNTKRKKTKVPALYIQADVENIPLSDDYCDYVICFAVFPSFQDKKKALLEITRVLKNGGKILIVHIIHQRLDEEAYIMSGMNFPRDIYNPFPLL